MIKKTGLVIAAAASSLLLAGCLGGACNTPDPCCEPACADPCNSCKCVSQCKQSVPAKKHKKRHYRVENAQAKIDIDQKMNA